MYPFRSLLTVAVAYLVFDATAVFAAGANIPSTEVVSLLRSANVVKADYPIRAVMSGQTATILTRRSNKSSEPEVKVDAMLIAKTLFDSYGAELNDVEVLFSSEQEPDAYSKIKVTQQQVKDFGSGKLTESQMLAALQVAHEDDRTLVPQAQAELQPGPYLEQRLALQDQIQDLNHGGTDTKPFQALFDQVEQSVKAGNSQQAHEQLTLLAERLQEQVELRKAANVPILKPVEKTPPVPVENAGPSSRRLQAIVSRCINGRVPKIQVLPGLQAAKIALTNGKPDKAEDWIEGIEHNLGLSTNHHHVPGLEDIEASIAELQRHGPAQGGQGAQAAGPGNFDDAWKGLRRMRKTWGAN